MARATRRGCSSSLVRILIYATVMTVAWYVYTANFKSSEASRGTTGGATQEKAKVDVVLEGFGSNKFAVIKKIQAITGQNLKSAKDLAEGVPTKVREGVSKEDAEKVKKRLEAAGASVSIR